MLETVAGYSTTAFQISRAANGCLLRRDERELEASPAADAGRHTDFPCESSSRHTEFVLALFPEFCCTVVEWPRLPSFQNLLGSPPAYCRVPHLTRRCSERRAALRFTFSR
jgi:hypothetical protein